MTSNIYRVIDEDHLFEILQNNSTKLVVVTMTTKLADPGNSIKKCLIGLSEKYKHCMFIYIDIDRYKNKGQVKIPGIPSTLMFFMHQARVVVSGNNINEITQAFKDTEERVQYVLEHPPQQQVQVQQSPYLNAPELEHQRQPQIDNINAEQPIMRPPPILQKLQQNQQNKIPKPTDKKSLASVINKVEQVQKKKEEQEKIINS